MTKSAFIPNFLGFYNILWQAALPFLRTNRRLSPTFDRRCRPRLPRADVWIQAASAGEAFLALSIVSAHPLSFQTRILVTSTTDQGLAVLQAGIRNLPPGRRIDTGVFPFDEKKAVAKALDQVRPGVMVLLETEIWPTLFHTLKTRGIPILILNARMSKRSGARYAGTRRLWQHLAPDRILAISEQDRDRYARVFPKTPATVMDNLKFCLMDTANPAGPAKIPALAELFSGPLPLSIMASFRRQEEALILQLLQRLRAGFPEQIIALFPRHMHRITPIQNQLTRNGIPFVLRSELTGPVTRPTVILWDRFGDLRQAYAHAAAVFVGGSLAPLGGQNFIEPVSLGVPTVIGPHWDDFFWVGQQIFNLGFVTSEESPSAAADAMVRHLKAPGGRQANQAKARAYIDARKGGLHEACQAIQAFLEHR